MKPVGRIAFFVGLATAVMMPQAARAEQTWGYVISWFHTATFNNANTCPDGLNPNAAKLHRRNLLALGYPISEIEKALGGGQNNSRVNDVLANRGRISGKPTNVYTYPESTPDPNVKTVRGVLMYGFDLDGKKGPEDFVDPETGQSGIDNQLFRAVGCFMDYAINLPVRPFYEYSMWGFMIDTMPAWIVSITGEDLTKDGPVTVEFRKATYHLERDANGGILSDVTYLIDEKPRSQNKFRGKIENRVLTIEAQDLFLEGESPILTELNLKNAQIRFNMTPSGGLQGYVGGYQPWMDFYFMQAASGSTTETNGTDVPGLYYALKRLADADPDPQTGVNRSISAVYWMEAIPAYLANQEDKVVAFPSTLPVQQTVSRPAQPQNQNPGR